MKRELLVLMILILYQFAICCKANGIKADDTNVSPVESNAKKLYLPQEIYRVPDGNDYNDKNSEFSHHRKVESADVAIFWAKEYGDDPKHHELESKRFDPVIILNECDRFYAHYRDVTQMVKKGNSLSDKYKLLFFVIGGDEGTAFGGGAADSVGVMWASSLRLQYSPYGAVAHEMAHCFQYLAKCDGNWAYSTPLEGSKGHSIFEMTAQYMLWQVYPEWLTFENYHLNSFMQKTHYAFLHETNMYHAAQVLEYWSMKQGPDFAGRLWRESGIGEDPVKTYKRLTNMEQSAFNDEMFDGYRRFMTWDLDRIAYVMRPYANQHFTKLESAEGGWYKIASTHAPQNYGYNGIKLDGFSDGGILELDFRGLVGADGYRAIDLDNAGWRYGFVASTAEGTCFYSNVGSEKQGKIEFVVPKDTKYLWLVVSGAPKEHKVHLVDGDESNDEQWPYAIKLRGASVDKSML
ncbi:DUF6055 domain-containing protein [Sphingobacterium tabacisoli]|uniref:DUF6055 domain-containing protein n=1 Tax=Sphingobacterium tabacisoli TaxID=2044855 RepID=A0ABW5L6T5_9SPHI|nr:DUF6055 domain-containing protein [Sphingobacterium tabacisoli]